MKSATKMPMFREIVRALKNEKVVKKSLALPLITTYLMEVALVVRLESEV